ncbi:MAG: HAD family phosphatase [Microcoleaceae cyanobacterium]
MLKAILFDLDGTLANTDPLHFKIWQELLKEQGIEINRESYQAKISGRQNPEIIQDLLPDFSQQDSVEFAEHKEQLFREQAKSLEPLAGFLELLEWIEKQQLQTAVVTNAPRKNADFMLDALNLTERFKTVILGEDMTAGKPDPAPYQYCLKQLNIQPSEAIVFEDSPSGIRSAIAAEIDTIGMATTHDPTELKELGVSLVIDNFCSSQMWEKIKSMML